MSKTSLSTDTSIEALQAVIDMLRLQEQKWRKSGSRRALHRYLRSICSLYASWKQAGVTQTAPAQMAKLAGLRRRYGIHPVRTIIDATSKADRRSKSRWTQGLRYAYRKRKRWGNFQRFLSDNGGIAGCASKWSDLYSYRRTPKGYVRLGGERFPKVPFLISVDLLDEEPWRSFAGRNFWAQAARNGR
jgi:hypothetical protein